MRKLNYIMHLSLDGYYVGTDGQFNWVRMDNDLGDYVHKKVIDTCDTAIYGRTTYEMMAAFWPNAEQHPAAQNGGHLVDHAKWVNSAQKIVISRTLKSADWHPTSIINENVVAAITNLKQQPGKDLVMMASVSVAQLLMNHGLIDRYLLSYSPVALGAGKPLFNQQMNLRLEDSKSFASGVMAGIYVPA